MTQQVARGGGLLVFDPTASARLPLVLQDALAVANRHDDFFSLHLEQQASPEFPITSIFANNQVGYVSLLPSPFGMQKRRANAVLTDLANNMRETRQQQQGLPPTVPFLLVLPRLSTWLDPVWTPFFSQARAFNIAILWQSDSITSVYKSGTFFANALMANSRLKLFLKDSFGQDYPSPVQGTELETEQALMERDGTYQKITLGQSG
ncbi:MAG: hypothetical protein Q7U16_07610 [Agitococcus sp.]|nr:hypothetical protein [Agitococcus sp.]